MKAYRCRFLLNNGNERNNNYTISQDDSGGIAFHSMNGWGVPEEQKTEESSKTLHNDISFNLYSQGNAFFFHRQSLQRTWPVSVGGQSLLIFNTHSTSDVKRLYLMRYLNVDLSYSITLANLEQVTANKITKKLRNLL